MGSRAIVQIAKDSESAKHAYGVSSGEQGIVYTRNGRRFFNDRQLESAFLAQLAHAIEKAGLNAEHMAKKKLAVALEAKRQSQFSL